MSTGTTLSLKKGMKPRKNWGKHETEHEELASLMDTGNSDMEHCNMRSEVYTDTEKSSSEQSDEESVESHQLDMHNLMSMEIQEYFLYGTNDGMFQMMIGSADSN